jgi:Flp pilus assembly protein TadG
MFKRLWRDSCGSITVEMVMVTISVIVFIPLILDLVAVIGSSVSLSGGMRAGMQVAVNTPAATSSIIQAVQSASSFSKSSTGNNVAVTVTEACSCAGNAVSCTSTCAPGNATPAGYITISGSYSVPTLLSYGNNNHTFPISNAVTVRVQ